MNRSVLLAVLLVLAAAPVGAHEPSATTFATATATGDTMTVDGDLDEDAWEQAEDDETEFDSPNDQDTKVWFTWSPDDELLYVGITVDDETDDGAADWIDFAFAFDHADDDADDGDQVIARVDRTGDIQSVSVEDGDVSATDPSDFDIAFDNDGAGYTIEIAIEWDDVHAGWAILQEDNGDDAVYPDDADLEDPSSWADVKGVKLEVDVRLTIDKTTAKLDDTLTLTAVIDDYEDLIDFDEKILFQRYDGTAWTTLASKSPDDDGEAKTTTKVTTTGALKYRARVAETDLYVEAVSSEVTVTVADAATKLFGDASLFVKYTPDADGWRTYTILANTTTSFPTIEVSPDGNVWTRIAKGDKGTPLTAVWTAPDNGAWYVRSVPYDAAGKPGKAAEAKAAAHALPGTRTASPVTLDVDANGTGVDLVATLAPTAASGSVTFYRAPDVVLGTGTVASGVARLAVAHALPGEQTYVARYGGSTTHLPSADRATLEAWPEDLDDRSPRETDASGEDVVVTVSDGTVVFTARAGDGPGLAGVVEIIATPEEGGPETLFRGATTTGAVTAPFTPSEVGTYTIDARFYRASGTGVTTDVRSTNASGADREVEVVVDVPQTATLNATVEVLVTLDPAPDGGIVTLLVDGEEAANASAAGEVALAWTPDAAGTHNLSARYSGAPGYAAAVSDHVQITVADPGPGADGTGDDGDDEVAKTPGIAWLGAFAALGAAAWSRKK